MRRSAMILTKAIFLLSMVSAAACLSTGDPNSWQKRPTRGRSSSLPPVNRKSSATASPATGQSRQSADVLFQDASSENRKRKSHKKVVARPPLVDSALLRFLAKQRRLREPNGSTQTAPPSNRSKERGWKRVDERSLSLLDVVEQQTQNQDPQDTEQQSQRQQLEKQQDQQGPSTRIPNQRHPGDETSISEQSPPVALSEAQMQELPLRANDSFDSWMSQFDRSRIARVLVAAGDEVDETLATQAGDSVQRHVLARMARRRVREFLKERDSMWVDGINEEKNAENDNYSDINAKPSYGFRDVVDVLMEGGLTAKDIAAILTHTPSIALMMPRRLEDAENKIFEGDTAEETLHRVLSDLLCTSLTLRRYDARKVLRNCPGLLTKRGSRAAQQVVTALVKLGISTSSIARDKNALPTLLSRPPAALFRLIAFLGSDAIRMPINRIGPLVRRADCLDLLDAVAPLPHFQPRRNPTTNLITFGRLDGKENPMMLTAFIGRTTEQRKDIIDTTYERMSLTAWTLRNEIGTRDLGKVIAAYPGVLLLDASGQVLPVAEYLMNELGIWEDDLARVLQLYPALLGMPIGKMKKVVAFFINHGVAKDNLASIFRSFPALLTLEVDKDMVPVVRFLRYIGIKNVGRFMSRLPPVLGYSVEEELIPKWEFIQEVYTYPSFELSKFPAFFSYPMDRITSRFDYLRQVKRLPTSLIAPDLVLRYGDRDFSVKVAGDVDDGEAYAEFVNQRLSDLPRKKGRRQKRSIPKKKRLRS